MVDVFLDALFNLIPLFVTWPYTVYLSFSIGLQVEIGIFECFVMKRFKNRNSISSYALNWVNSVTILQMRHFLLPKESQICFKPQEIGFWIKPILKLIKNLFNHIISLFKTEIFEKVHVFDLLSEQKSVSLWRRKKNSNNDHPILR